MKYLADTDILVDHIRGKKYLKVEIVQSGIGMSIITLGELLYGAYKSVNRQRSLKSVGELLDLGIEVENLDSKIIDKYAQDKVSLEKLGQRLDGFDLLIAATAQVRNLILLTRNVKHFQRITELKLFKAPN